MAPIEGEGEVLHICSLIQVPEEGTTREVRFGSCEGVGGRLRKERLRKEERASNIPATTSESQLCPVQEYF
jgi:hypothetical protein